MFPPRPVFPLATNARIAVITHAIDEFADGGYLFSRVLEKWDSGSLEIEVMRGPDGPPPEADLAICHVDMTAVGEEYARWFEGYPRVINGRVLDISKSVFSDQVLTRDDAYDGPVIVKTQNNFGGFREMQARYLAGDPDARPDIQRPWKKVEFLPAYPAFASMSGVPLGVWRNPNLVVEKFRPEQGEDGTYVLRVWIFLGDRGIYYQCVSEEPIIKSHNTIRRVDMNVADVPEELREKRRKLGFDYGKFDFGIVDGEVVLYDVNRTPGGSRVSTESERAQRNLRNLSEGLGFFLRTNGQ